MEINLRKRLTQEFEGLQISVPQNELKTDKISPIKVKFVSDNNLFKYKSDKRQSKKSNELYNRLKWLT